MNSNKCAVCNKKILISFTCKCSSDKIYCNSHRYAEKHNCTFDYKTEFKNQLIKNNPIVVSEKVIKI